MQALARKQLLPVWPPLVELLPRSQPEPSLVITGETLSISLNLTILRLHIATARSGHNPATCTCYAGVCNRLVSSVCIMCESVPNLLSSQQLRVKPARACQSR